MPELVVNCVQILVNGLSLFLCWKFSFAAIGSRRNEILVLSSNPPSSERFRALLGAPARRYSTAEILN